MTKEISKKLRQIRRNEIIPAYFDIRHAFERAMNLQPKFLIIASIENDVWEVLVNGKRVGGVSAPYEVIDTAVRLLCFKTGCSHWAKSTNLSATAYVHLFNVAVA